MFGTIMRARAKPGQREALVQFMAGYEQRRRPDGFESVQVAWGDQDPDQVITVVRFRDRESYMANATDPDQDREYRAMLEYLQGEPEWVDVHFQD